MLRYWPFGGQQFSPEIERIISRRRVATWTAAAVMVAVAVARGTGPSYLYALILALWAVASGFAAAQTMRLRRRDIPTLWLLDAWYRPLRPELIASRDTRRDLAMPVIAILALAFFAATLSNQVNAVAYLTGQAPTGIFLPQTHSRQCAEKGPANCATQTTGILEGSGTRVVYLGSLPLGRPTVVRAPLWRWPAGQQLLTDSNADWFTLLGMAADVALVSMSGYVLRELGRRRQGLPWRSRPVPEEEPVTVPAHGQPANSSTRNTARKKLKKQRHKR